jgi:putative thioredoxin
MRSATTLPMVLDAGHPSQRRACESLEGMVDMGSPKAPATHVVDVTDTDFEQVVIEGSKQRPVVVDMWAAWCGPCRTLGPILEKVAAERDGAFLLAKLDVDANAVGNALLQAVQSQGIPTVVAFRDGQPVNMFIGAYPEPEVNRFIDTLVPSEAEIEADEAMAEEAAGDLESAEAGYRDALEKDPENGEAAVGLARILLGRGELDQAKALVEPLLPDPDAERVMATVRVRGWATDAGTGPLGDARRDAAAGRWREALDGLLAVLEDEPDAARASMVDVFATLDDDPLVAEYRPKLAARLF